MKMRKQSYMTVTDQQFDVVFSHLSHLLAYLRAAYLSYQTSHWQTHGSSAYGNHLLFQRLYESVTEEIDQLAEKLVGYFGPTAVDMASQGAMIAAHLEAFGKIECPHRRGLEVEAGTQKHFQNAYDAIKGVGAMTLGLDDWLMAAANAHETNTYLLQQVLSRLGRTTVDDRVASEAPSAEHLFFDNPERREVREFAETKAPTNIPAVAVVSGKGMDLPAKEIRKDVAQAKEAPPTPKEIEKKPGAEQFSTLNRYVVETEQPGVRGLPEAHEEVEKHPILASWTFVPRKG